MLHCLFKGFCGFVSEHGDYIKKTETDGKHRVIEEEERNVYQNFIERTLGKRPLANDKCTSDDISQWISGKSHVVQQTHLKWLMKWHNATTNNERSWSLTEIKFLNRELMALEKGLSIHNTE
jgi:hypothetical protein